MTRLIDSIREAGAAAWLKFVQSLNALAVALLGGALVVHQSYPELLGQLLGPIPAPVKALALFAFGTIVHLALARARSGSQPGPRP